MSIVLGLAAITGVAIASYRAQLRTLRTLLAEPTTYNQPATSTTFGQPEVVMVDTSVNVICYLVRGQVACTWVQSAARVRHQLGID